MNFDRLIIDLEAAILDGVNDIVEDAAAGLESRVPRLSGHLASTIKVKRARKSRSSIVGSVSVGDDESPAGIIEFGSIDTPPHNFFRATEAEVAAEAVEKLSSHINPILH